jgi:hypothetical protein
MQTHGQQGDLIRLLSFFQNKESRLRIEGKHISQLQLCALVLTFSLLTCSTDDMKFPLYISTSLKCVNYYIINIFMCLN